MDLTSQFNNSDDADVCLELRTAVVVAADACSLDILPVSYSALHHSGHAAIQQDQDVELAPLLPHVSQGRECRRSEQKASAPDHHSSTRLLLHAVLLSAGSPYFKTRLGAAWNKAQTPDGRALLVEYVEEDEVEAATAVLRFLYSYTLGSGTGSKQGPRACLLLLRMTRLAVRFQVQRCVDACLERLQQLPGSCWDVQASTLLFGLPEGAMQGGAAEARLRSVALQQLLQLFTRQPWVLGAEERRQFCSLPRAAVVAWIHGSPKPDPEVGDQNSQDSDMHVLELVSAWADGQQGSNKDLVPELLAGWTGGSTLPLDLGSGAKPLPGPSWSRSFVLAVRHAKLRVAASCTNFSAWRKQHPLTVGLCALLAVLAVLVLTLVLLRGQICNLISGRVCSPGAGPLLMYTALAVPASLLLVLAAVVGTAVGAVAAGFALAAAVLVVVLAALVVASVVVIAVWEICIFIVLPPLYLISGWVGCPLQIGDVGWNWGPYLISAMWYWAFTLLFPFAREYVS